MGTINLNYGDWYFGEWKNGKLEGHGTYHVESGLSTEAYHPNNRPLSGKAQYSGEFRNNKRNGFGIMKYSLHAEQYIGFWMDNKFHGEGIFIYGDNQLEKVKEGLWINGTFQKESKVSFNYKLDEINGSKSTLTQCQGSNEKIWNNCHGSLIHTNGSKRYDGEFKNGKFHGVGLDLNIANNSLKGDQTTGVWQEGILTYGKHTTVSRGSFYLFKSLENFQKDYAQNLNKEFESSQLASIALSNQVSTQNSSAIPIPLALTNIPSPVPAPIIVGKRLALVIGNASYKVRPLLNPRNDADDVSRVLRSTGFEVIDLRDATLAQMRTSVRQFGERLMSNDVGLVYYSGHGIEVKGRNYFIPVNADIKASDEVADQALDVSLILAKMDTAKKGVNILIVDACRDDPFGRSFRSNSRGLATMDAPQGTLIAYATAPGSVAADGTGRNSPFTKHLVRAMQVPNTPIELMFKEVRRAVREETKNQQTPWENSSLIGNFYFSVKK
jgi:hypothetical protein